MTNLYEAKMNTKLQVMSIPDVGLLKNLGLRVGTNLAVQTRYSLGGPVLLRIEDTFTVAVGKDIATQIAVMATGKNTTTQIQ